MMYDFSMQEETMTVVKDVGRKTQLHHIDTAHASIDRRVSELGSCRGEALKVRCSILLGVARNLGESAGKRYL